MRAGFNFHHPRKRVMKVELPFRRALYFIFPIAALIDDAAAS